MATARARNEHTLANVSRSRVRLNMKTPLGREIPSVPPSPPESRGGLLFDLLFPGRQDLEVIGAPDRLAAPLALERWLGGVRGRRVSPRGAGTSMPWILTVGKPGGRLVANMRFRPVTQTKFDQLRATFCKSGSGRI